jgi:3-oxoacyl-[acyl-carrier protein] reductase
MDLGLTDRTSLVLGGGGGLGGAIAAALLAEGSRVAVADIDLAAAQAVTDRIDPGGGRSLALAWDLADLDVVDGNVGQVEARLDAPDILVNLTGGPPPTPVSGQPTQVWQDHFRSMVASVVAITDRVLPAMTDRAWGRIITSTSSGVVAPIPNLGLSNALRSSLLGWSKTLAGEVGRYGVTVNIVVPGRIATRRTESLDAARAARESVPVEQITAQSAASMALRRYGRPDEYAAVVAFLAGEPASYITGSTIRVDGGLIPSI